MRVKGQIAAMTRLLGANRFGQKRTSANSPIRQPPVFLGENLLTQCIFWTSTPLGTNVPWLKSWL